jgi:hypothetical protein
MASNMVTDEASGLQKVVLKSPQVCVVLGGMSITLAEMLNTRD